MRHDEQFDTEDEDGGAAQCDHCGDECDPQELQDGWCQACIAEQRHMFPEDELIDGVGFAEPGGRSALRAATFDNPRNLPCPNCRAPNRLTPIDRARGYQCDACADQLERGGY